jgi:hypothetical protein
LRWHLGLEGQPMHCRGFFSVLDIYNRRVDNKYDDVVSIVI